MNEREKKQLCERKRIVFGKTEDDCVIAYKD